MKETKCAMCGRELLVCDVCEKRVEWDEVPFRIHIGDAWGFETFNFCCVECMLKWLFELAPSVPKEQPKDKEVSGEIRISGLDRYNFLALVRTGKLRPKASKKGK